MKHDYQKGDLVWWTLDRLKPNPIPFEDGELFIGIVTAIAKKAEGVEVYWLNNGIFKIMNYQNIMRTNF